jgi:hypothetical protein
LLGAVFARKKILLACLLAFATTEDAPETGVAFQGITQSYILMNPIWFLAQDILKFLAQDGILAAAFAHADTR